MIKNILGKFRLFSSLYGKAVTLFSLHWFKFLIISVFLALPLFVLDEWLYLNEQSLKALNLYSLLDACLYGVFVLFLMLYYLLLHSAFIFADKEKVVKWAWLIKKVQEHFFSYSFVQMLYFLKIVLWGIVLIIPGIFSIFVYSFSGFAFLVDGRKGKDALRHSKEMVVNHLNCYFDMLILIVIIQGALFVPFYLLINQLHRFLYISSHFFLSSAVDFLIGVLVLISLVVVQLFFYYLYEELKVKEAVR